MKLVRVDGGGGPTPPPAASITIELTSGVHPFGRGVFLDLHLNPCFIVKKGAPTSRKILKSGSSEVLECGDKFGVLPNSHWYELVSSEVPHSEDKTAEHENGGAAKTEEDEAIDFPIGEEWEEANRADSPSSSAQTNGQSKEDAPLRATDVPITDADDEPINFPEEPEGTNVSAPGSPSLLGQNADATDSSAVPVPGTSKRQHSADAEDTSAAKQARTDNAQADEPEDVKPSISDLQAAVAAGSAPVAAGSAPALDLSAPVKKEVKDEPASCGRPATPPATQPVPVAPAPLGRERCMYGAQCYRRNPQHKLDFSHPSDTDWGPGAQGVCPWGAGCTRRDPRHWRDHSHPPGMAPPGPAAPNRGPPMMVVRHGMTFYINAHAVHFHEEHFNVEDSDGDSVDYDYEF